MKTETKKIIKDTIVSALIIALCLFLRELFTVPKIIKTIVDVFFVLVIIISFICLNPFKK
jgi:hypothetical protein